jgi:hypothetical protein
MLVLRKEVKKMTRAGAVTAEKMRSKEFNEAVEKLRQRVLRRPFDMPAHTKLMNIYLSENMFPEAESEQEILEWLDRIKRNVRLNNE